MGIPGATRQNFTITNVAFADAGFYTVVASNVLSGVSSTPALLTVTTDLNGPTLVAADGSISPTNVLVTFSEFVSAATATNPANYKVTNVTSGGTLVVTNGVLTNGTQVLLRTTAPRIDGANYLLIVNNVQDISTRANVITPNSSIPISSTITLVGVEQFGWEWFEPLPFFTPPDPGNGWTNIIFNNRPVGWTDSAQGLFVFDPQNNDYPATKHSDLSGGSISTYFRFPFKLNASPAGARLQLHHIVDDGAVFYLNGPEVYRFNMRPGPVATNTPAAAPIGLASLVGPIDLPVSGLVFGTNVLAAELHGTTPPENDQDLVFGADLKATILSYATGTVMITSGPYNITVAEGDPVTFGFTGIGASSFQWKTNGGNIPGATGPTLAIPSVPLNWNGKLISVTASNATSSATSSNAVLTVVSDVTPPTLVSASRLSATSIGIAFSEPITAATATNTANYRVTNSAGPNLTISSASLSNGTNVTLNVSAISSGAYTLVVNNIRDASSSANLIASNTTATIGYQLNIPIAATWRFFTNNIDLGTTWRTIGYADTAAPWSSGPALIADEGAQLPEAILTPISRLDNGTYHYTFYFRYHFTAPSTSPARVTFRHIIDDGCVMYINDREFHRFNMPEGPVDWMTQGGPAIGDAAYNGPYTATFTNLVAGDNVIAVEVHQSGTASSDITFGATYDISVDSVISNPPPRIQITKSQGTNVVVSWAPSAGWTLEKKALFTPSTLWAPVTNRPPFTVAPRTLPNPATFYQLQKQ